MGCNASEDGKSTVAVAAIIVVMAIAVVVTVVD